MVARSQAVALADIQAVVVVVDTALAAGKPVAAVVGDTALAADKPVAAAVADTAPAATSAVDMAADMELVADTVHLVEQLQLQSTWPVLTNLKPKRFS